MNKSKWQGGLHTLAAICLTLMLALPVAVPTGKAGGSSGGGVVTLDPGGSHNGG